MQTANEQENHRRWKCLQKEHFICGGCCRIVFGEPTFRFFGFSTFGFSVFVFLFWFFLFLFFPSIRL